MKLGFRTLWGSRDSQYVILWVANAGAAGITANSILSALRVLPKESIRLVVAAFDERTKQEISASVSSPLLEFMDMSSVSAWTDMGYSLPEVYSEFDTSDFNVSCIGKYHAISDLLRRTGNSVIFSDGDVVFLRDPIDYIRNTANVDETRLLAQNDRPLTPARTELAVQYPGGEIPVGCSVCAGFTIWRPSTMHIGIAEYIARESTPALNDQAVFNNLPDSKKRQIQLLRQDLFPNGSIAFPAPGDGDPGIEPDEYYIAHANWRVGLNAKVRALQDAGYWYL